MPDLFLKFYVIISCFRRNYYQLMQKTCIVNVLIAIKLTSTVFYKVQISINCKKIKLQFFVMFWVIPERKLCSLPSNFRIKSGIPKLSFVNFDRNRV